MNQFRSALVLACAFVLTSVPAEATPEHDPGSYAVVPTEAETIFEPPGDELASFPVAHSIDRVDPAGISAKRIFVGFSRNPDVSSAASLPGFLRSDDDGTTFEGELSTPAQGATNLGRLRDGSLLNLSFKAVSVSGANAVLELFRSTDLGETWERTEAPLTTPEPMAWMRLHRGLLELADGTLLVPVYVGLPETPHWSVHLVQSTDGGASWSRRSVIAAGSPGFNETAIEQVADGSLLAVMRTADPEGGTAGHLVYTRSTDLGLTWDAPKDVLVPFDGNAPAPRVAVDPDLLLMPNGVLVLSAGRMDNWIAISPDGTGGHWQDTQITYVNYPTTPAGASRIHGSSGYTGIADVGSNRLFLTGDNCANSWGCPPSEGGWTIDGKYRIWKAYVDVLTPDVGKIDLAGKVAAGRITVETTMTDTVAAFPEARPEGAFDGSTAPWASAVGAGADPAHFTFWLDRMYDLTRVGLCLRRGHVAAAEVYVTTDGIDWGTPVITVSPRAHHALEYFDFPTPVRAGAVKIVTSPGNECGLGLSGPCAMLNEVELYSSVDSFENDPLNAVPRGYENAVQAWTTAQDTDDSSRALRLRDDSDTAQAKIARYTSAAQAKTLEFRILPVAMPNAFLFDVLGTNQSGQDTAAYHLAAFEDGSLHRYDSAAAQWLPISSPGQVNSQTWSTVRIIATTSSAKICVGGVEVATTEPSIDGITALTGHAFASAGTVPKGSNFVIDDVLAIDALLDCSDEPAPVAGEPDAGPGQDASNWPDGTVPDDSSTSDVQNTQSADPRATDSDGCACRTSSLVSSHRCWVASVWLVALLIGIGRRRRHLASER